jgi:hypothetical protein
MQARLSSADLQRTLTNPWKRMLTLLPLNSRSDLPPFYGFPDANSPTGWLLAQPVSLPPYALD